MELFQPPAERHSAARDFPAPATVRNVYDDQDLQRAVEAYRFFYPTVSNEAVMEGIRQLGIADGTGIAMLAAGPRHAIFTANSDTPYAIGVLDLRAGPMVVDVPPGRYMGFVNDHDQRWVADLGIPGEDGGQGGKYLLLPPDFAGEVPSGYYAARSSTYKVLIALRAVPPGGNFDEALQTLRRIEVKPLAGSTPALPYADVTARSLDCTPLRWEDNLEYWRRLAAVIELEPARDEFRPMYGALAALGIEKGRRFAPDARMRRILETAARVALEQMRVEGFANGRSDVLVWPDRQWEWVGLTTDDPNFETDHFIDLQARDRWFVQAVGCSPAMFRRKVGAGSIYFVAARDRTGAYLDGALTYKISVPQPVPAQMFWSVTAYDARTRCEVRTPQDKAALSSLRERFVANADGSVDLFFGPTPPKGKEAQWVQTTPGTGFFLYFRIYGPEAASLNGKWKPGDPVRIGTPASRPVARAAFTLRAQLRGLLARKLRAASERLAPQRQPGGVI